MNLEEEILGHCDNANNWNIEEVDAIYKKTLPSGETGFKLVKLNDAIKIAKQYAKEQNQVDEFAKLYKEIKDWQKETFLKDCEPPYDIKPLLAHFRKELNEIEKDPNDMEEWADALILLLGGFARQFSHRGFISYSLILSAKKKLEINKSREWGDADEFGIIEHKSSLPKELQ